MILKKMNNHYTLSLMETGKYYNKTSENTTNRVLMTAGEAKKSGIDCGGKNTR